jgi:SPP1 gp7 family putative phage head morphogenesis protein
MPHAKIRLIPRRQAQAEKGKTLRGKTLRVAVSIEARYAETLLKHIERMTRETEREIRRLFEADNYAGDYGMDANIGSRARIVMNTLTAKFDEMFARVAGPTTDIMVDQVDKNSAATLKSSLKEIAGHLTFKTDIMTGKLQEMIAASAAESVALIKRVPGEYLEQITGGVMRAITSGNGLEDLVPLLEKQKVQVKNWAQNVAMDQTRKVYSGLQAGRMNALGIQKYEWVHSGGSNHPREYHRDVLNGKIFRLDDPPIIDLRTGERGKPGDAINCRCTMRPIVSFEED